jgi:REP element-mobilizing transposase RayT
MARPLRVCYPGAFYHITSRGNEKKKIFKGAVDRKRFLSYLESATLRYDAVIHVYCLMGNHYHLLLETPSGNLSQIMRHINGAYTTYFNTKHRRVGHLLQGRYKAILVERDEYAKALSRYIHQNPLRAGMVEKLEDFQWSSYLDYIGERRSPAWLRKEFVLGYFAHGPGSIQNKYREFVCAAPDAIDDNPLSEVVESTILGSDDFVRHIKEKFVQGRAPHRDLPALNALITKPTIEEIIKAVKSVLGHQPALSRNVSIYLCHKFTGQTLKEIGRVFQIGESAVSQASRRIEQKLKREEKLFIVVEQLQRKLKMSIM